MNYIKIAERVLKRQREGIVTPPELRPVLWKGLQMTIDEAWAVICALKGRKPLILQDTEILKQARQSPRQYFIASAKLRMLWAEV